MISIATHKEILEVVHSWPPEVSTAIENGCIDMMRYNDLDELKSLVWIKTKINGYAYSSISPFKQNWIKDQIFQYDKGNLTSVEKGRYDRIIDYVKKNGTWPDVPILQSCWNDENPLDRGFYVMDGNHRLMVMYMFYESGFMPRTTTHDVYMGIPAIDVPG